jgi:hypothetical protein
MVKKMNTSRASKLPEPPKSAGDTTPVAPAASPREPAVEYRLQPEDVARALEGLELGRQPKFTVGTVVPNQAYLRLPRHRGAITQFIESAIHAFDGDLRALVLTANRLDEERKAARFRTSVQPVSGRVTRAALTKLDSLVDTLRDVPDISRSKVLGALILIHLPKSTTTLPPRP